ncbi:HTTM domain-containing protein [Hymenobacter sp. BT507]|uniref:HTTM domain-containing protein n=1 Tax=Hymenobacter citatus TaxID=2763506 RepID=A0ABR7MRZ2_9BACT|nr:HTTM domain-containing protein [Hymenobacter citatus]MBC6613303.1 HTTM domain-containing protein [Hymenobacter citatus]
MNRVVAVIRRPFVLDVRALALLRVAVSAVVLVDLAIRATDLEAHYSNMGVLPLHVLYEHNWNPYEFSFHTSSGLWQVQAILFLLAAAAAVAMLLGYRTRLMTIVSWVLLVSVQNRNPLIGQGGDDLLRMLLFWGIFLPWGRVYSLDSRRQPSPTSLTTCSAATVAYIVQLALLYWCTALLKSGAEWTQTGTALYYALSLDQMLLPVGRLLYPYPELMRGLTFATYYTELLLPFALFIPWRVAWWRGLFIGVLVLFHLGISLTLFVGLFFLINWASLPGLLPPTAMDWLERKLVPPAQRLGTRLGQWRTGWRWPTPTWRSPVRVHLAAHIEHAPQSVTLLRAVRNTVVSVLLVYICWWNFDTVTSKRWAMPERMQWLGYLFRIDQHWGMFAPAVFKDDGWYILEGTTAAGRKIDLNRGGAPLTYTKPASVVSLFPNDRWRKYSENYLFVSNAFMRPYYCNYLLRIWGENARHPRLKQLEVIYMKEVTLPNYKTTKPTREVLCGCAP